MYKCINVDGGGYTVFDVWNGKNTVLWNACDENRHRFTKVNAGNNFCYYN
jgi:hypothetical protein